MEKKEFLKKFENEKYVEKMRTNSGKNDNHLPLFTSNFRRIDSFGRVFLEKVLPLIGKEASEQTQNSGQEKFKHWIHLFGDGLGMVKRENRVLVLTNFGAEITSKKVEEMVEEINEKAIQFLISESADELKVFIEKLELTFPDKTLQEIKSQIMNSATNKQALIKIALMYDSEFLQLLRKLKDYELDDEFIAVAIRHGILKKYNTFTQNSLLDLIDVISTTTVTEVAKEVKNKFRKSEVTRVLRDQAEVEKVLIRSRGICEVCKNAEKQFMDTFNNYYVEVHHVVPLGSLHSSEELGKFDKEKYMIALCPFHHRYIHRAKQNKILLEEIIKILELEEEKEFIVSKNQLQD